VKELSWRVRIRVNDGHPPTEMTWEGEAPDRRAAVERARLTYPNPLPTFEVYHIECFEKKKEFQS